MNNFKRIRCITIILLICFAILLLSFPGESLALASSALGTWFNSIVPSLFPFAVIANMLIETNVLELVSLPFDKICRKLFSMPGCFIGVYICSAFAGYPTGARLTAALYKKGRISEGEAKRMTLYTSVCGSMFICSAVSVSMLKNSALAPYILIPSCSVPLFLAALFKKGNRNAAASNKARKIRIEPPTVSTYSSSVSSAASSMLGIGAAMLLFGTASGLLMKVGIVPDNFFGSIMSAFLEMTTGLSHVSSQKIPLIYKCTLMSFFTGFSGLSVIMQSYSAAEPIKLKSLLPYKGLQALIQAVFTYYLIKIFHQKESFAYIAAASPTEPLLKLFPSFLATFAGLILPFLPLPFQGQPTCRSASPCSHEHNRGIL